MGSAGSDPAAARNPTRARPHPACRHSGTRTHRRPPAITAIICGIDQVLITFDHRALQRIDARYGLAAGTVSDTLTERPSAKLATIGAIGYHEWLQHTRGVLPPSAVQDWLAYHGTANQPAIDLLRHTTASGLRLILWANATARRRDDLAHHQLHDLAQHTYLSCETGYATPDPRAYQHLLHTASLNPATTLYIDHQPSYLHIGRDLGLRIHRYRGPTQLQHALARAGAGPPLDCDAEQTPNG